jgi:TonB family protein
MPMLVLAAYLALAPWQTAAGLAPASQSPPVLADSATPADPKARLALGRTVNGLQVSDVERWHLKASYEVFDNEGKSTGTGTFEEWRINQKQYKLAYQSAGFSQQEYGTDHGIYHSGDQNWPSFPLSLLLGSIVQPVPSPEGIADWGQMNLEREFGSVRLLCTALTYIETKQVDPKAPSFCFDQSKPILLYSNSSHLTTQTIYNDFVLFEGSHVAREVKCFFLGRPALTIHIDTLEPISGDGSSVVAPPSSALPVVRRLELFSGGSSNHAVKKVPPEYPEDAKAQHIEGTVILYATLSTTGRVRTLRVLSGPQLLQKAAVDAVRQWLYKPFLMDGEPVEVNTLVTMIFNLGGSTP